MCVINVSNIIICQPILRLWPGQSKSGQTGGRKHARPRTHTHTYVHSIYMYVTFRSAKCLRKGVNGLTDKCHMAFKEISFQAGINKSLSNQVMLPEQILYVPISCP